MTYCVPRVNLCIPQASDWSHDFIWQNDGVAVDLTGYSARMQIQDPDDGTVILDISTAGGGISITALTGTVTASLTNTQTRTSLVMANYSLILKSGSGDQTVLCDGRVRFSPVYSEDVA